MFTKSRLVCSLLVAASTATIVLVAAPMANAKPISDKTIKSECKSAGGTYSHSGSTSLCSYKDNGGNKYTDWYENGQYTNTTPG